MSKLKFLKTLCSFESVLGGYTFPSQNFIKSISKPSNLENA